jgi:hypothetical protein
MSPLLQLKLLHQVQALAGAKTFLEVGARVRAETNSFSSATLYITKIVSLRYRTGTGGGYLF